MNEDDDIIDLPVAADGGEAISGDDPSDDELLGLLQTLKKEHRRIDNEIKALYETGVSDVLKIKRMKKIKLSLKDKIAYLENQLTPDIIA